MASSLVSRSATIVIAYLMWKEGINFDEGFTRVKTARGAAELRGLLETHAERTGSDLAATLLSEWDAALPRFVKVMPDDYKRVMEAQQAQAREAEAVAQAA